MARPTGQSLESLIQYGWWGIIAKPLYLALRFLHADGPWSHNWGWAIIIVTTIFNLSYAAHARLMAMKSSLKMMRIQPKLDAIKKKLRQPQDQRPQEAPR